MADQPTLQGFLKGLLSMGKPDVPPPPGVPRTAQAPVSPKISPPRSEAYHQRKKGRKPHEHSLGDLEKIASILQQKVESTPGEMAQQLGMARSTLAYNLKRLIEASQRGHGWRKYQALQPDYVQNHLFGGKRLEKLGAGKYVRYRLVEHSGPPPAGEA